MGISLDRPMYRLVEKYLKANKQPMTCNALMEIDEVRTAALEEFGGPDENLQLAINKTSDLLGFMWRRGLLSRYSAPKGSTSFARYSYEWSSKEEPEAKPILPPPSPSAIKQKLNIQETPNGVEIELEGMIITTSVASTKALGAFVNQDDRTLHQAASESGCPPPFKKEKVMNIDYGQILKNAMARQQALELLEAELSEVGVIMQYLALAERRVQTLLEKYKALDEEGRNLLGPIKEDLNYLGVVIEKVKTAKDAVALIVCRSTSEES